MNMDIQAALDVADETDAFLQITDVIYDKEADDGYDALSVGEENGLLHRQSAEGNGERGVCPVLSP